MNNVHQNDSIYTNQLLQERYVLPEEVANYATLLVSKASNMIVDDIIYIRRKRNNR